jgi:opacity protein-like surface antigen
MKRFLSILLLLGATALSCHAQDEEPDEESSQNNSPGLRLPTRVGNYMAGANILFANATFQKGFEASYNIGLSPKLGFFVLPNIALGLSGDINISGNKGYRSISYGVSPFARVYFARNNESRPAHPLQVFVEGGVGFGGTNSRFESSSGTTTATTNGIRLYVLPGVDYFINSHVAAELGLEYLFIGGKPNANIIGLNVGFQIFLGR